jgi:site-specific DNA-cytosine methylase
MKVLVACEFSGVVRRAFRDLGHDAYSCDILDAEDGEQTYHIKWDILDGVIEASGKDGKPYSWDLLIAHPPCTHLAVSGARWFKDKQEEQREAIEFVEALWNCGIPRICIENPIGVLPKRSSLGKSTQIIQPWQFGHGETKATCLWLKNLPKLIPADIVEGREAKVHRMPPGPNRWKDRSRTYEGIAKAMAEQWGNP